MSTRGLGGSVLACALWLACACSDDDAAATGSGGKKDAGDNPFGNVTPAADGAATMPMVKDAAISLDACGAKPFLAHEVKVNVLLVIDKSGSMLDTPDGFSADKWSSMQDSLATALGTVAKDLSLGLLLYPSMGCGITVDPVVPVSAGANALPMIEAALAAAAPDGGTPTAAALEAAFNYFSKGDGAQLEGEKYVLLATDGGPNCNDTLDCSGDAMQCTVNLDGQCPTAVANCCDPAMAGDGAQAYCLDESGTLDRIKALATAGVPTFVVGIPGTEKYASSLDAFALAGGRENPDAPPSYYAVNAQGNEPGGLTDVLTRITSSLIHSCRLQLDSQPPDPTLINVKVDGTLVPQSGGNGWMLDDATDPPTIELLGDTCKQVEQAGAQSVEVLFGCPTVIN